MICFFFFNELDNELRARLEQQNKIDNANKLDNFDLSADNLNVMNDRTTNRSHSFSDSLGPPLRLQAASSNSMRMMQQYGHTTGTYGLPRLPNQTQQQQQTDKISPHFQYITNCNSQFMFNYNTNENNHIDNVNNISSIGGNSNNKNNNINTNTNANNNNSMFNYGIQYQTENNPVFLSKISPQMGPIAMRSHSQKQIQMYATPQSNINVLHSNHATHRIARKKMRSRSPMQSNTITTTTQINPQMSQDVIDQLHQRLESRNRVGVVDNHVDNSRVDGNQTPTGSWKE